MAITLEGIAFGARYLATVSQLAVAVAIDIPEYGVDLASGGTLELTLVVNEGTPGRNQPPHAVEVEVMVTGFADEGLSTVDWDASVHRLEYSQDSGDHHAGSFLYGEKLAIPSRRMMFCKKSLHLYRHHGGFMHRAYAFDHAGNWGVKSVPITVAPPDYDPARIVVVALDENYDHAPYCVTANRAKTLTEAAARLAAITGSSPKKIWFKRGESYVVTSSLSVGGWDVDAWGPDDLPNPKMSSLVGAGNVFVAGNNYASISNIDVEGLWDPVGEKYPEGELKDYLDDWYTGGLVHAVGSSGVDIIVDRCSGKGASANLCRILTTTGRAILHESRMTDSKEFMMFGSASAGLLGIVGCEILGHPESANGGLPRNFFNPEYASGAGWYASNAHNSIRSEDTRDLLAYGNTIGARHGWSTQYTDIWMTNAVIRGNSNGVAGCRAFVVNNWIESMVVTSSVVSPRTMPAMNNVWEFNTFVRDPTLGSCIALDGMGNTIRNNRFIIPDPAQQLGSLSSVINVGINPVDGNIGRNEIYNNTIIDLARQSHHHGSFAFIQTNGRPNSVQQNNVYYAPNLTVPQTADGPLDLTILPWEPFWLGHRKSYELWRNAYTLATSVPVDGSIVIPYQMDRNGTMTSAASFAGHFGKHLIKLTDGIAVWPGDDITNEISLGLLSAVEGTIEVEFEAGGIRITNKSSGAWPSGAVVQAWLHRGSTLMAMNTSTATPLDSLKCGWATPESGAYEDATSGLVSVHQFDGSPRPGSLHPNAAPGANPDRGAMRAA